MIVRFLRSPVLHFLLLGALLFAADAWRDRLFEAEDRREIVIPAWRVERLRAEFELRTGSSPTTAEEQALLDQAIDEELLYQEALVLGLDRTSDVVRRRLVQVMEFVESGDARTEEELYREALELGIDRSDIVVRRHLVETMRLVAKRLVRDEPTEDELRDYLVRNAGRFRIPERARITHVYLSRDRRGESLESDATRLLETLRESEMPAADAVLLGDPFLRGHELPPHSAEELDRVFGPGFGASVLAADAGTWAGPLRSAYGLHLVRLHEKLEPRLPALDSVRNQVRAGLVEERAEKRLRTALRELRHHYQIRVDDAGGSA